MARDKPASSIWSIHHFLGAGPHRTGSGLSGATALPPPKGASLHSAPEEGPAGAFHFRVGPAGLESQPDQIRSTCRPGEGCRAGARTQTFTHPLTHSAYTRTPHPHHNTTQQLTATSLPARSLPPVTYFSYF